jgi:putative endonuclease
MYYLYILRCADGTLYTGLTVDLRRRVIEHNTSRRGAKYTRSRRPVKIAYHKRFRTRSTAASAEARIKALPRLEKLRLLKRR